MNISLLFSAGMYRVRSSNCSFTLKYCSTSTALSCSGVPGYWSRIAYLSNNNSPVECPMGFEVINNPNVPALCKRNPTGAVCSSITELETRTKLLEVVRDMNTLITKVGQYINHLNNSHEILASKVSLLREELYQYQDGLNRTILNTINATNSQLEQVRKKLNNNNINATIITETQINNFTMKIIADMMVLHSFNSCGDLGNYHYCFLLVYIELDPITVPLSISTVASTQHFHVVEYLGTGGE